MKYSDNYQIETRDNNVFKNLSDIFQDFQAVESCSHSIEMFLKRFSQFSIVQKTC